MLISRCLVALVIAATLAALWNAPLLLGWGSELRFNWLAAVQVTIPAIAAFVAGLAAYRSSGRDRLAWAFMAAGGVVYVLANIAYVALIREGTPFPTLADGAFFLMALLFGAGIILYGQRQRYSPVVDTYNFILLYGAIIVGTLFLLHSQVRNSILDESATIVAFLYPALWCSVAALSAVLLAIYPHGRRSLPLAILVLAVTLEGIGDILYATQLMEGRFEIGSWPHVLWMSSATLVAWAAAEHALIARSNIGEADIQVRPVTPWGEAGAPAAILFVILITGSISGAFGRGLYTYFSGTLAMILAVTVGLREHWIIKARRRLEHIAEERLHQLIGSEKRLISVLETTSDSVIVVDGKWRIGFFNQHAAAMVPELVPVGLGGDFWKLFRAREREVYGARFEEVMQTGQPIEIETYNTQREIWLQLRVYATGDGISLFFRNVTEQRRIRDEIERLAHYDFLTGLSSRAVFTQRLESMPASAHVDVLLVDLDSFKEINDTLGHTIGDAVLVKVAERLREVVPEQHLVARLGGDEFAVIAQDAANEDVIALAERTIEALSRPFIESGEELSVGASIGIASTDNSPPGLELLTKADIALYEAKASGSGKAVIFHPAMEVRIRERKEILADLTNAIANDELELDYQPLLDMATQTTAGFEALVRWRHPARGRVGPDKFIPLAEESGLIVGIGEWVLRTACRQAATWPAEVSLSVNISTRQFSDHRLVDKIVKALTESGLDHRRLELEVTESALLRQANLPTLKAIRELGIRLALDDFGTGYSSLSYLKRVQFDKLKIDQSFVKDAPTNAKSKAIVETVANLARALGMTVTAEGVENAEQMRWISGRCDQAQGYFISRPMPAGDIAAYLQAERKSAPEGLAVATPTAAP